MIGKSYRRHAVETVDAVGGELARLLDSRASAGATLLAMMPHPRGGVTLAWELDLAVDETVMRIYEIVSPEPPNAGGVDYTDAFKAKLYDRLRTLIYGPAPEPAPALASGFDGTAAQLARAIHVLKRLRDLNNGPDLASGEYRCIEAAAIAEKALAEIGR